MSHTLLILGASTRAAAFSALAAGLDPVCADLFADVDLASRCPATTVANYPQGLAEFAQTAPPGPWMYTGGLENHLALVDQISASRALWGNTGEVLARVRDPFAVQRAFESAGLVSPAVQESAVGLPRDGTWLRKSMHTSGGQGVQVWSVDCAADGTARPGQYFQRRVTGQPAAASYLAAGGRARLLGATEQLLHARPGQDGAFQYSGSCGPLRLDARQTSALTPIGQALAAVFNLCGLFGVDYLDDGRDIWPVEVNPRYTASLEILERGLSFSAVGWHVDACRDGALPVESPGPLASWHAKRILYATTAVSIAPEFVRAALAANANERAPTVADIPAAGSFIPAGKPVMTVLASASTRREVGAALDQASHDWEERLYRTD